MPDETPCPPNRAELLAPAGGYDALVAAVRNGADAVYLGLQELNARRGAENFTLEGLAEACDFAHLRGARVYLTANVLVLPGEMSSALALVDRAWAAGVDAVIVQDLGLLALTRREMPHVRVHASTQLGAHNLETLTFFVDRGVARATLARELALPEVAGMAVAETEIETFVHGALCVCYSGQCLLSSMIGGRSANRGRCAQPCRLPYTLIDDTGASVDGPGAYLLSPRDLAGAGHVPELLRAGVAALKIEGRMKSPEYVALVTGVYRGVLDRAMSDPDGFEVTDGEWSVLEEAFSRGFTTSYLDGTDEGLMGPQRPNNRGVLVGRVVRRAGSQVTVGLERALDADDRLEFWTRKGRFTQPAGRMTVDGRTVATAPGGVEATLTAEGAVGMGDRVFRVANARLLDAARRTFARADEPRPTAADVSVEVTVGAPLRITVSASGRSATATGPPVETARTKPITAEEIIEHVGRMGGTPYEAGSWDIALDPTAGLGYSQLHRVRREALDGLDQARLASYRGREVSFPAVTEPPAARTGDGVALVVVVGSDEVGQACLDVGADRILRTVDPAEEPYRLPEGFEPRLSRVARRGEPARQVAWLRDHGGGTVGNLGVLGAASGMGLKVSADWPLNSTNAFAVEEIARLGAEGVWLSPELTLEQVALVAAASPLPVGVSVLGRQELMITEHCVLTTAGACDERCGSCTRRVRGWELEDRKGYRFPVTTDGAGRGHLFNAVPLDVTHALGDVVDAGTSMLRLDLGLEPPGAAARLTRIVRERLDAAVAGADAPGDRAIEPSTTGHFFRGVE